MKKILGYSFILLASLYISFKVYTVEDSEIQSNSPINALLIFLDDSEFENLGPVTGSFLAAFVQQVGPIIVSASIVNSLYSYNYDAKLSRSAYYGKLNNFKSAIKHWTIKEINNSLYLLLPNKLLKENRISLNEEENSPENILTQNELKLGLKIDHMKTVSPETIKTKPSKQLSNYFVPSLATIFITNKEYRMASTTIIPQRSLYAIGHGGFKSSICNLSIKDFKDFLYFLEKLHTKILIYTSCYAAGTNTNLVFKDSEDSITKTYSFPIITNTLTDATAGLTRDYIQEESTLWGKEYKTNIDFNEFMKLIISPEIDYNKAVETLHLAKEINSLSQIKLPGLEWFSILDQDSVISIGSIMARTRTKPLDILPSILLIDKSDKNHSKTLSSTPKPIKGILLYETTIPFEIILHSKKQADMPFFVSMIPGDAIHSMQKITSLEINNYGEYLTLDKILTSFYIDGLLPTKTFLIQSIEAPFSKETKNKLTENLDNRTFQSIDTIEKIVIKQTDSTYLGYFTYQGTAYTFIGTFDPVKIEDPAKQKEYDELWKNYANNISVNTQFPELTPTAIAKIKSAVSKLYGYPDGSIGKLLADKKIPRPNITNDSLSLINQNITSLAGLQRIPNIKHLKKLDFSYNNITLTKDSFDYLTKLETLTLSGNKLQSLPDNVFANIPLQELDLSSNQLTLKPTTFSNFPNLKKLTLSFNQLTTLPEGIFDSLTSLEELDLSGNQLSLKQDFFSKLTNLKKLTLSFGQLTTLPNGIFNGLTSLEELDLSSNALNLKSNMFNSLPTLKKLNLARNNITSLPHAIFNGLTQLEEFNISQNRLDAIDPLSFAHIGHLKRLNAGYNKLTLLKAGMFKDISSLESLDISGNPIERIQKGFFQGLPNLKIFTFYIGSYDNPYYKLSREWQGEELKQLIKKYTYQPGSVGKLLENKLIPASVSTDKLSLRKKDITDLDGLLDIEGIKTIKVLDLSDNKLTTLPTDIINELPQLEVLNLSYNAYSSLSDNKFLDLPIKLHHVKTINLSNNILTSVKLASETIQDIDLSHNKFTGLSFSVVNTPNLKSLSLSNNSLKTLPKDFFEYLNNLEELDISDNLLEELHEKTFNGLSKLHTLKLYRNNLTTLPIGIFNDLATLKYLDLSENQLQKISSKVFKPLKNLKELDLYGNKDVNKTYEGQELLDFINQ